MEHVVYNELDWEINSNTDQKKYVIWENNDGGGTRYWKVPKGTGFPNHSHKGYEHIFVLDGVMDFSGQVLEKGDCLLTAKDEEHEAFALEDSVILVVAEKGNP